MKTITDTLEVSRSNQYEKMSHSVGRCFYRKDDDEHYHKLIREITDERPTYGYRRATAVLNRGLRQTGLPAVNHKRVYRIMKINNLLLQKHTGRSVKVHDGTVMTTRSNMRWCSDAFEIACWNGERLKVAFSLDCCDREILSYIATTGGICGDMVCDLMAESIEKRFGPVDQLPLPIEWLSDNGPAYTARKTRDFGRLMGLRICTTPYYSPESNGMAESFVKTFKRDYVNMNVLYDAKTTMEQLPKWFEDYNENHPHKGLKMRSPREFIKQQLS
jgi:putative transposase